MVNLLAARAMLCNNLRETVKQLPIRNWEMAWFRAVLCDWLFLKTLSALVQKIPNTSKTVGIAVQKESDWGDPSPLRSLSCEQMCQSLFLMPLSQEEVSMACSKEAKVFCACCSGWTSKVVVWREEGAV